MGKVNIQSLKVKLYLENGSIIYLKTNDYVIEKKTQFYKMIYKIKTQDLKHILGLKIHRFS
jgi:hypothetical protein